MSDFKHTKRTIFTKNAKNAWWTSAALAALGNALGAAWMVCLAHDVLHQWWQHTIALVSAIAIGLTWYHVRKNVWVKPEHTPIYTEFEFEPKRFIDALIVNASTVSARYGSWAIALLADMLAEPKTYQHRLTESIELDRRAFRWSVRTSIFIDYTRTNKKTSPTGAQDDPPTSEEKTPTKILVPLAQQKKGQLYDQMTIGSSTDGTIASLSYGGDSMAAFVAVLMHLYAKVYGLGSYEAWESATHEDGVKDQRYKKDFVNLVEIVSRSAAGLVDAGKKFLDDKHVSVSDAGDEAAKRYRSEIERILGARTRSDGSAVDESDLYKLQRIATIGITHYVIIVQCQRAEHLDLSYSYSQPTAGLRLRSQWSDDGSKFVRRVLDRVNVPSRYLDLSMIGARNAKSYHMMINAPKGGSYIGRTYILQQRRGDRALDVTERQPVVVNARYPLSIGNPYIRRATRTRATAHAYGRHLGRLFLETVDGKERGVTVDDDARIGARAKSLGRYPQVLDAAGRESLKRIEFCLRIWVSELPTGTELFAMVSAWSLLLMTFVLMRVSAAAATHRADVHTDIVVAAIALPATIGALAIFFVNAFERSLFVSPPGFVLTILAALVLVFDIVVFAVQQTSTAPWSSWVWYWSGSLTFAAILTIAATGTFAMRFYWYNHSQRPSAENSSMPNELETAVDTHQ